MTTPFLGLEARNDGTAPVAILPMPLELTVSYGAGTAGGPAAILDASAQVELFDCATGLEIPSDAAFETGPAWVQPEGASPEAALDSLTRHIGPTVRSGRFCVGLGGEHTVTLAMLRGLEAHGPMTIIQIDAHSDLRDSYEGSRYSHACVMHRALEMGHRLIQLGVRAMCREEWDLAREHPRIRLTTAREITDDPRVLPGICDAIRELRGPIYLSIDVDGLDPSVVPGTGTPVPGGLSYGHATRIIDAAFATGGVVGMDIVELAPIVGQRQSEFTAASLAVRAIARHLAQGSPT